MTRKNVYFSGHLLSSETIRSDTIKKSVNSVRCYQIAFRGLGNHAESLADTFPTPRKPCGEPRRIKSEASEKVF